MFEASELTIAGCRRLVPRVFDDARGRFVKVFHAPSLRKLGLETDFVETYYSKSGQGVLRGLHYQAPPHDHAKLVHCSEGRVLDVLVDLRAESTTFGAYECLELDAESAHVIYIPRGIAHGFLVTTDSATLHYQTTSVYVPESDRGIRWDTVGIPWPENLVPVVSDRDQAFPIWEEYARSPLF